MEAQQRLAALLSVSAALADAKTGIEARERILAALADGLRWPLGAFWGPDGDGSRLVCLSTWSARPEEPPSADYEKTTRETTFAKAEGIPGRVWASGRPLWVPDVQGEEGYVRAVLARRRNLRSALFVPVPGGGRLWGVLELADFTVRKTDAPLHELLTSVGEQLGRFIDREQAEAERRVSEARSQAILASALDAVVAMDHRGHITEFNPAAERIFGFSRDAVIGRPMGDVIVPPDLRDAHRKGLQRYLQTEEPRVLGQRLELPGLCADGSIIPCELYIVRIPQEGPPAFTAFLRDITDRKRQREALQASEARIRALVEHMLEGLIVARPDGVIQELNPAGLRMFGYSRDEIVGQSVRQLMAPEGATAPDALSAAYEQAVGRTTEWPARRKSGEIFPMELQLWDFETAEGRLLAGYVRDLSERHEVDRLKKEFVATVSHELRTPLTSLRGSLGLLTSGVVGSLPPDTLKMVEIAERNTVRLIDLINGILDLERLGTGAVRLNLAPVRLAEVMEQAHEALAALAREADVALDLPRTEHVVLADERRLVQVLVNLLGNAVKFSRAGSSVGVEVDESDGQARVRVLDRGRGVPADMEAAIFEPFRQVEGSDARRESGTGLGLAISRAIVEQHGGRIGVEPRGGGGSVFWFTVPLASDGAAGEPSLPRS